MNQKGKIVFLVLIISSLAVGAYGGNNQVFAKKGNIYFKDKSDVVIQLTHSGRDREPIRFPGSDWVYFIRSFPGEFKGELYYPPSGHRATKGHIILKEVENAR